MFAPMRTFLRFLCLRAAKPIDDLPCNTFAVSDMGFAQIFQGGIA